MDEVVRIARPWQINPAWTQSRWNVRRSSEGYSPAPTVGRVRSRAVFGTKPETPGARLNRPSARIKLPRFLAMPPQLF